MWHQQRENEFAILWHFFFFQMGEHLKKKSNVVVLCRSSQARIWAVVAWTLPQSVFSLVSFHFWASEWCRIRMPHVSNQNGIRLDICLSALSLQNGFFLDSVTSHQELPRFHLWGWHSPERESMNKTWSVNAGPIHEGLSQRWRSAHEHRIQSDRNYPSMWISFWCNSTTQVNCSWQACGQWPSILDQETIPGWDSPDLRPSLASILESLFKGWKEPSCHFSLTSI